MPALSVEASIAEMERCLKLGFRGVWLNTMPSVGATIRPEDDPFWAAAQANGVAVHFHVRVMRALAKPKPKGARGDDLVGLASVGAANMIIDMGEIIQSGVHDRFPNLTWVMVEAGSGWIPYILEQLDDRWHRNRSWLPVKLAARAELLLPPQLALDVHGRPLRDREPPPHGRRQPDVLDRLPAPRLRLAAHARDGREALRRRSRRRALPRCAPGTR